MGSDDESYSCISQQADSEGIRGVKLDKVPTPPFLGFYREFQAAVSVTS